MVPDQENQTGALGTMGHADRPPSPPLNLVGDYGGGALYLALGVVSALFDAARHGQGQVVDAAMVYGAASLMTMIYSLKGTDACIASVLNMDEAPTHLHIRERGIFVKDKGVLRPAPAPRLERAAPLSLPSSVIGEHTLRVLRSQGLSEPEIEQLRADHVIAGAE